MRLSQTYYTFNIYCNYLSRLLFSWWSTYQRRRRAVYLRIMCLTILCIFWMESYGACKNLSFTRATSANALKLTRAGLSASTRWTCLWSVQYMVLAHANQLYDLFNLKCPAYMKFVNYSAVIYMRDGLHYRCYCAEKREPIFVVIVLLNRTHVLKF